MNVSVVIPVYNAEKYLEKAVFSALQHNIVKEVILVEDASPDNALAICQRLVLDEPKVKLYQHPDKENKGAGASRNLGVEKATMDYVAFLDADDYFLENRFDKENEYWNSGIIFDGMYNAIGVKFYTSISRENFCKKFKVDITQADNHLTKVETGIKPSNLFLSLHKFKGYDSKGYFSIIGMTVNRNLLKKFNIKFNEKLRLHQDTVFIYHCAYSLNLLEGELKKAVSLRGVHDENRITSSVSNKQFKNRYLMFEELHRWAIKNRIESILPHYYYQKKYNQMMHVNLLYKWSIYIKLVVGKRTFFRSEEARIIHFNLCKNKKMQKVYESVYLRIYNKFAKK